jgi:dipeptidyl aminopeptidase/acylaminoacyl peptidase
LAAVVLGAGAYDFFKWYPTPVRGIDTIIASEAGTSAEAFELRSASYHAAKIRAPVLVLHGAHDQRIPVQQAIAFSELLKANRISVKIQIFPDAGHHIPIDQQYQQVYPFLDEFLR